MKYAVSNIALTAYEHSHELTAVAAMGVIGLEVAPSRVWRDTWRGLTSQHVSSYRQQVAQSGLQIIGLHSLLYDQPELRLFRSDNGEGRLLNFLAHLSAVCRDLGGQTLIWGAGRRRGELPRSEARYRAIEFLMQLCDRIAGHGTVFCFEPLGPTDDDFINKATDALDLVMAVNHPALRIQLDAKALVENGEAELETFTAVRSQLTHFHANEPGLGVLGSSGVVDHQSLGGCLRNIGYNGWVSIEQRMLNAENPLADIAQSIAVLRQHYGSRADA